MRPARRVVTTLRVLLALAFAAIVVAQIAVLPAVWARVAADLPDLAHLRAPTLVVAELELICVQVVIACTWQLVSRVAGDRIFHESSFRWVDVILGAMAAGWLLLLGAAAYVATAWDGPGLLVALLVMLLAGAVVGLLMVVMRALLQQATTLQADMEGVI